MSLPTRETFRAWEVNLGIELPEPLFERAVEAHAALRPELEALRRIPLSYVELVEPATATSWIENGGRSAGREPR